MILPGKTDAALRGRNLAEGYSDGRIETMNGAQRLPLTEPPRTGSHTDPERQDLHDAMLILPVCSNPRLPSQGLALVWRNQAGFDLGR